MKIIKNGKTLTVVLDDGQVLNHSNCTPEIYMEVVGYQTEEDEESVKAMLMPKFKAAEEEYEIKKELLSDLGKSSILTIKGASIYMRDVSELTIPEDLAVAVRKAEKDENKELLQSYINFWTLCSLNPDSRARANLFWFLNKYGMKISRSGLFVAFRLVEVKKEGAKISTKLSKFITQEYSRVKYKLKKSPAKYFIGYKDKEFVCAPSEKNMDQVEGNLSQLYEKLSDKDVAPVYTDNYSRTMTIQVGKPVTMEREKCDAVQENTCSRGLHVAGRDWLLDNYYFGKTALKVLVNPADVVAVPPADSYGKMRTCAYYPIEVLSGKKEDINFDAEIGDGFEDNFMEIITYEGDVNNEDAGNYAITLPNIPEVNNKIIGERLEEICKSLKEKVI